VTEPIPARSRRDPSTLALDVHDSVRGRAGAEDRPERLAPHAASATARASRRAIARRVSADSNAG
jgi:hypothetical protein